MSECGPHCSCADAIARRAKEQRDRDATAARRMVTATSTAKGALVAGLAALTAGAFAGKARGPAGQKAKWRRVRNSPDHAPRKVRIR